MRRDEYRVVQLREGLIGGKLSDDTLERLLDKEAEATDSSSRSPPRREGPDRAGGVDGVLITIERPVG